MIKFLKSKLNLQWFCQLTLYLLMPPIIYFIYFFKSDNALIALFISLLAMVFIALIIFSYINKLSDINPSKNEASANRRKLLLLERQNNLIKVNGSRYLKVIYYQNKPILETNDWITYKPRSAKKTGINLTSFKDVEIYLKKVIG